MQLLVFTSILEMLAKELIRFSLQKGEKVRLTVPALDGREVSATVYYIAVRESYATWKATKEIGEYDTRTFEVRARPDSPVEGLLPGMSVILKRK